MTSMKDIAKELNLSRTTVSNILNNKFELYSYKEATINSVLEKAKEMGYIPNNIALSLKTGKTNTIAVIVPDISNDFYVNIITEMERLASKKNLSLIICFTEESLKKENQYLNLIESRMVDGVLIAPVSYNKSLSKGKYPFKVVCFDRTIINNPYPSVCIDNYNAAKKLASHLLNISVTKPIFLAGSKSDITNIHRLEGFKDSLKEHNLKFDDNNILYGIYDDDTAFEKLNHFIMKKEYIFDSIYLSSNYSIYGVLKSLNKNKIKDIPISGFENFKGSEFLNMNIYKVEQPEKEIARKAFEKLILLLNGEETNDTIIKTQVTPSPLLK